jgi:flagellar biogenesis protein FliO
MLESASNLTQEISMYIGGGLLGTVLLIVLIVWLVRRV